MAILIDNHIIQCPTNKSVLDDEHLNWVSSQCAMVLNWLNRSFAASLGGKKTSDTKYILDVGLHLNLIGQNVIFSTF